MRPFSSLHERDNLRGDDRAVSTALGYVLSLAITSLLISGLMFTAGGYVEDQREQVIREELEVIGQTLIADIEGADRLAVAIGDGNRVEVASVLPRRVGSSAYSIDIVPVGGGLTGIELRAATVDVTVQLRLVTSTPFSGATTVDGGELVVVYDGGSDTLEVQEV